MREDHFYLFDLKEEEKRPMPKAPYGPSRFNPISFDAALEIAPKNCTQYPVDHAWDLESQWLFSYDTGDPPIPGVRSCLINKNTSEKESFFPPKYKGIKPSNENMIF